LATKTKANSKRYHFDEETVDKVWEKGKIFDENLKEFARDDEYGTHMGRINYNNEGEYGWKIEHIKSESNGGTDDIDNLKPLHWKNDGVKNKINQKPILRKKKH
jgi:hypothetical protein